MIKILALPRYESMGASSRYRMYQYFPALKKMGYKIDVVPLLGNDYIRFIYYHEKYNFLNLISSYFKRIYKLLNVKKYDIVWVQQELFPWVPSYIEKLFYDKNVKLVTDYDDAFFHRYDMHSLKIVRKLLHNKIDKVMENSHLILSGNEYIKSRALSNDEKLNVKVFPTVVDLNKYNLKNFNIKSNKDNDCFVIGWIGNPGTESYLNIISDAVKKISSKHKVKLKLIGAKNFSIPDCNIEYIEWLEGKEPMEINRFDVGIMPLENTPWEKGKCGFKLIQYMACGIPVIATPVGINNEIIINNYNGFKANNTEDWVSAFEFYINYPEKKIEYGINGRKFVEQKFSLNKNILHLDRYFKEILSQSNQ